MTTTYDFAIYDVEPGSVLYADHIFYVVDECDVESDHMYKTISIYLNVRMYDEESCSFIKSVILDERDVATRSLVVFSSDQDEAKFRLLML